MTAADGEALVLGYNAAGQLSSLATLQIPAAGGALVTRSRVDYSYDSSGRLTSVSTLLDPQVSSDTSAFTTTYAYVGSSLRVAQLSESNGTTIAYAYAQGSDGVYRVASVTTGTGAAAQTLSFSYDLTNHITTVTDATGRAWAYAYDGNGNLISVTSPAVNSQRQVTSYQYTADGHLAQVTDAAGNTTTYQYDANGNRILEQDAAGNTVAMTYNADDQLLTRTVYLAPARGSTAASQPETTYYVYDSNDQLRFTIDATGDVTETQYNSQGLVSMTRQFAGAAYNVGSLSAASPPALTTMTNWAASQDLTQTTRVDYSYNAAGRLTEQEAWDTVDAAGNGVLDNGTAITQYVYDSQGLLRQQVMLRGSSRSVQDTTSYAYDGLGRLLSSTDALGHTTTYTYDDAQGQIAVTQANGLVQTKVYNSAGELVTVTLSATGQSSTPTTQYTYDAAGELWAVQNADGGVSYTFYDAAGRVAAAVDATGAVTQFVRDADGRVTETIAYATRVNTTGWLTGGTVSSTDAAAILPASSANDRTTYATYDAAGRLATSTDAVGAVTTYTYDGASNLIEVQVSDAAHTVTHTTRTFYDAAGRTIGTLDPDGYLTETVYDAAGRVSKTIAYATMTSAALQATGTLAELQPAPTAQDQVTRNFYDDRGNLVGSLDADGYLTTYTVDSADHQRAQQRYAQQLTGLTGTESLATLQGMAAPSGYQQTLSSYDADGQLIAQQNPEGTVTQYSYDSVGHLIQTQVGVGTSTVRATNERYDVFGNLIGTLDGVGSVQLTTGMSETQLDALYQQYGTRYTYDALGRRTQRIEASGTAGVDGATTWYLYDADGRLAYTVHGVADANGNANALGEVQQTTYDAFGDVAQTVNYAGRIATSSLATIGTALTAIANAQLDATETYTYTARGQVASAQDGVGYLDQYVYDAFGNRIQTTLQVSQPGQPAGSANTTTTTDVYDARGQVIDQTANAGGLNVVTQTAYDAFGRVVATTDARGAVTQYAYDPLGRQISTTRTVQGQVQTSTSTYDAYGRVLSQTDALGNTTAYAYNTAARSVTVTSPEGVTLTTVHDAFGDTVSITDSAGNVTQYAYDLDGRLISTTDPNGAVSSDAYNAVGNLIQTTDATGHVVTYTYDARGRTLSRTVDPGGLNLTTTYAYDGRGQQISSTDPTGVVTTTSYDADGHVLTVVQDAGSGKLNLTTTYTWDGLGDQLTVTQGAGTAAARTTAYVYDGLGRRVQTIVDPSGLKLTTSYTYDGNGNLTEVTDAKGALTRSVYNAANEKIFTIDPMGAVTQTYYDADGHVVATRAYANALSTTQLSALGSAPTAAQVTADLSPDATRDALSYQVYDADGQVTDAINADGAVTVTRYNSLGQVAETLAYPTPVSVSSTLQASLLAGTATPSDITAIISDSDASARATLSLYDTAGRLQYVVTQGTLNGATVGFVTETRYDAAGRVIASIEHGTPLPSFGSTWTTASVAAQLAGDPTTRTTQYVYDNAGRQRYAIDSLGDVTEQRYDADGRITETLQYGAPIAIPATLTEASVAAAVTTAEAAPGVPATRLTTATYDDAGRLIQTGDALGTNALYTYDATGLKTSYTNRDGATWTYAYDSAGRRTQETSPAVTVASYNATTGALQTTTQSIITTYAYDALGNLTSRTQGVGSATPRTIQYVYDADGHQIQTIYPDPGAIDPSTGALVPTGNQPTSSVTYNALGLAVVGTDVNGHVSYKVYDAQGQLRYSVDATGHVTGYQYDAYGDQVQVTRYANALNTAAISGWTAGSPLSISQVQSGLSLSSSDRTIATTYDARGNKIQVTLPAVTAVLPDGTTAVANPTTNYTYDALGNLTSESTLVQPAEGSNPAVWATTYHYYNALGQKLMTVDPMGYVTTWQYDATGDVVSTTQYARAISTLGLTPATMPSAPAPGDATTGYDRTTTYTFDALGRTIEQQALSVYNLGDGSQEQGDITTATTYDGEGRVTRTTVNGVTTQSTQYDALGRVTEILGAQHQALVQSASRNGLITSNPSLTLASSSLYQQVQSTQTFAYDALGDTLQTVNSATGAATGASDTVQDHYDGLGRLVQQTHVEANQTTYSAYDAAGNLTSSWYTLSGNNGESSLVTTLYTYDPDNRQLSTEVQRQTTIGGVTQPTVIDSATAVQYDAFGEIVGKGPDDGTYPEQFTYDNAGRQATATDATTGAVHTYGYDLAGHQVLDQVPVTGGGANAITRSVVDLDGRVIEQILPPNNATGTAITISKSYDRWGNVTQIVDGRGYATQYFYNTQNQLTQEIEPLVNVVGTNGQGQWLAPQKNWYYDALGRLIGTRDENGNTNWFTYDAAGNQISATDGTGAVTLTAYDARGRAVLSQNPDGHITWTSYNTLNQVTGQGDFLPSSSGTTRIQDTEDTYVLNQDGDRIQTTDALGNTTLDEYDSQHRLLESQTPTQVAAGVADTYTYDSQGNKTSETTALGDHETWAYDYFGRVTAHTDLSGATYSYTYDASSGLLTASSSTWLPPGQNDANYGYLSSHAEAADAESYTYFANGQLASETTPEGIYQYQYDANGNRTVENSDTWNGAGQENHVLNQIVYDSHNRIARVTSDDLIANERVLDLSYLYDAVGNRRAIIAQSGYGTNVTPISTAAQPPTVVATPPNVTLRAGAPVTFEVNPQTIFNDPQGGSLSYSAAQIVSGSAQALPSWLSVTSTPSGSLLFSASAGSSAADNESFDIQLTATNPVTGLSATTAFMVSVVTDAPPTATAGATTTFYVKTGESFSAALASSDYFTDSVVGNTVRVALSGTLPPGLTIDNSNPSVARISGTVPAGTAAGTYTLALIGTDQVGESAASPTLITLKVAAPQAPLTTAVGTQTAVTGHTFDWEVPLSTVFTDPQGDAIPTVTATLANGSPLPTWLSFQYLNNQTPPAVALIGPVPASAAGSSYSIQLTATNTDGLSASTTFTLHVVAPQPPTFVPTSPITIAARDGLPVTFSMAASSLFTDPQGDTLEYGVIFPSGSPFSGFTAGIDANNNFDITGTTPSGTAVGTYTATLYALNSDGLQTNETLTFQVKSDNPPVPPTIGTMTMYGGHASSFTVPAFTQSDGDALTYSAGTYTRTPDGETTPVTYLYTYYGLPSWLSFDPTTLTFSGTPPTSDVGTTIKVYVQATDPSNPGNNTGYAYFPLTIDTYVQPAPTYNGGLTNQSGEIGAPLTPITLPSGAFTESDGGALSYSGDVWNPNTSAWQALSTIGLSINSTTGTISGTPTVAMLNTTSGSTAAFTLEIVATNGQGDQVSGQFTLTNTFAPPAVISAPGNVTATPGQQFTWTPPTGTFSDPYDKGLTYTFAQSNGSALPSGITQSNGSVSFWAGGATQFTLLVTATDGLGRTVSTDVTFIVPHVAPQFPTPASNQTASATLAFSYTVPAATDANGYALTYSAAQSGGGALPSWLSFNAATRTFSGTPPASASYTLIVTASDGQGASASTSFTLAVSPPPDATTYHNDLSNPTWTVGQSVNYGLPSGAFTNTDGNALSYSAEVLIPAHTYSYWNSTHTEILDKNVAAQWVALSTVGLSVNSSTGQITGTATTLNYADNTLNTQLVAHTSYQIQITAQDAYSVGASGSFTASLVYAPPTVANPIPAQSLNPGQSYTIPSNTFSDPYGSALTYTATLSSGAALPSGFSLNSAGTLSVGAVTAGTYTLTITATDGYGSKASTNWSVTVNNVAPVFSAAAVNVAGTSGSAFSVTEPAATDANGDALTYTAGMYNGSSWVALPSWANFNPSTLTFTGTPPTTGTWTFAYWANDGHGGVTGQSFTVTANLPPNLPPTYNGNIPSYVSILAGNSYTLPSGDFTSPYGQTLTYTATLSSGAALPTWITFYPSSQTFATATSKIERTVDITITAHDPQGRTASDTFTFDVVGNSKYSVTQLSSTSLASGSGSTSTPIRAALATTSPTSPTSPTAPTTTTTTTPNTVQEWFTYDADNRVVIANGQLVGGAIVLGNPTGTAPSYENSYDAAGNVVSVETIGGNSSTDLLTQRFSYDLRGERTGTWYQVDLTAGQTDNGIQSTQQYDADGHLLATVQYFMPGTTYKYYQSGDAVWTTVNVGGWLMSAQDTAYNADGQVTAQASYARPVSSGIQWYQIADNKIENLGTLTVADEETVPSPLPAPGSAFFGQLSLASATTNQSYDAEGNLTGYSYTVPNQFTATYTVSYLKRDGYLEQATAGSSSTTGYTPATDTSLYDTLGQRVAVQQTEQLPSGTVSATTRVYSYDGDGQILGRTDGTVSGTGGSATFTALAGGTTANPDALAPQHYVYAEGHSLATLGANGTIQLSDGLSAPAATASSNEYTVQAGDTLQSIAQDVYGNATLWYVIADANAISVDSSGNAINLIAGTTLKLPAVSNEQNSSQTFDPYNPLKQIGSTTPALAYIPPPPSGHCNTLADLIVVAVTAFLAPEMEPYLAGALGGSAVAGWAAAGFAANTAGQLGADAVGVSNGYSFSAAVIAGIGDGVTGPLSAGLASQGDSWASSAGQLDPAGEAVLGASGYAASVVAARIIGEPTQFSWAGMAAAALGATAATTLGLPSASDVALGQGPSFAADVAGGVLDSAVTREASLALGDTRVPSWKQIGIDAFGNALGNAAYQGLSRWQAAQAASTTAGIPIGNADITQQIAQDIGTPSVNVPNLAQTTTSAPDFALPAPGQLQSGNIPLPNGDVVLPDGTVLVGNGSGSVNYLLAVSDRPSSVQAFWNGDPAALQALLSQQNPGTIAYNTSNFNPNAPVQLDLGYGVDNAAVNAAIAKSPILTAGLNEAFANGFSVQLAVPGGEDVPPTSATYGVIEIPAQDANDPTAIVSTLAHELGHVLWGNSNQISYAQFVSAHMTEPQFVQAQTARYLQGEGVATLTNIAVAEQIWPNTPFANLPVNGIQFSGAPQAFNTAFTAFSNGSESLAQAASSIGTFYGSYEHPGNDQTETYGAMYTPHALALYTSYADKLNATNATLQFQNRELQWQQLNALRARAVVGPQYERAYEQALRAYESGNGGGQ